MSKTSVWLHLPNFQVGLLHLPKLGSVVPIATAPLVPARSSLHPCLVSLRLLADLNWKEKNMGRVRTDSA